VISVKGTYGAIESAIRSNSIAAFRVLEVRRMKHVRLAELPWNTPFPGWKGRFMSSSQMTFVYWEVSAGTVLPEHSHPHEQVAHGIEGRFEIVIDGTTTVLEPGSIAVVPSGAVHSGRALTDCRIMDAFCPVREDYVNFECGNPAESKGA
jgi:quercetin dioxygenase-like cupin family protein